MSSPRFYNKDGTLTHYAMGCGYIQTESIKESQLRLSYNGCTFDVKVWHDHELPHFAENPYRGGRTKTGWAQFDTLTEARRAWRAFRKRLKQGETLHDQLLLPHT